MGMLRKSNQFPVGCAGLFDNAPVSVGRLPDAWRMAASSLATLLSSRPVMVSRRLTGMPAARLADSSRTRRSPPEQGSSPARWAVMAASQSMAAMGMSPLVPQVMNCAVKSSRFLNGGNPVIQPRRGRPAAVGRELVDGHRLHVLLPGGD